MVSYLNTNRRRGSAIDRLTLEEQLINLLCGPLILMQLLRILVPVPLSDIFKENYPTSLVLPQRTQCTMYIVGEKGLLIFLILGYSADFERVSLEAPSVGGMKNISFLEPCFLLCRRDRRRCHSHSSRYWRPGNRRI